MSGRSADFYFAAMSPYSWFAAERIDQLIPHARWHPVTAAFIFRAAGRTSWGLTEEREQGIAKSEQRAAERGLGPIVWPQPWPTSDVPIARAMIHAEQVGKLHEFALAAMRLAFLHGCDLAQSSTLERAALDGGLDPAEILAAIADPSVKQRLREGTDRASALGVFGVPTVIVAGELFWGDDRLQDAAAAARER